MQFSCQAGRKRAGHFCNAQAIPSDTVVPQALARATAGQDHPARTLRQGRLYPGGHELRIIEQGRTDAVDSTSLHVPSIDLVGGGDVFYNQCQMYVADTPAAIEASKRYLTDFGRLQGPIR